MMSRNWKKGFFSLTLVLSVLFGFLVAKKTVFYERLLKSGYDPNTDVMRLQYDFSTESQFYLLVEFLISFAVPFGLIWLLYFITMRFVVCDFTVSDWSLIRKMRAKD